MLKQAFKTGLIILFMAVEGLAVAQEGSLDSVLQKYDHFWEMTPGLYRVMKNHHIGVVDSRGREIVPCRFDQVWTPTKDQYIRVLLNMKTGLYHLKKGIILPAEYDQIWEYDNGLAKVMKNRKFGFADMDGRIVVPCEYQHVWSPRNGLIKVMKDGLTGYIKKTGEMVIPVVYQHIWDFEEGMARVVRDGKMGYVNDQGNEVVPAIYDQVWPFEEGEAMAVIDGDYFKIDKNGNIIETLDPQSAKNFPVHGTEDEESDERTVIRSNHPFIYLGDNKVEIFHDGEGIQIENKKIKKKSKHFRGHLAGIGLALNGYLDNEGHEELPAGYEFMELDQRKSLEVVFYPWEENVRLLGDWFGLTTGLGVQYNNYRFKLESYSDIPENGREWFPVLDPEETPISKSKLMMMHLNVPVMVEIQMRNGENSNNLYISGGVVGGVRLQTHTKLVYRKNNHSEKKKKRDDLGLPLFRYGFMAKAGFGSFSIYGTYYPKPMFKDGEGPELYPYSIGVMLNLD
ncbi:WG repeat-containing protein [Thermophagus sp. OGC60D27]|uniref:WG repeat-containing protein n=1 Tax=Thermophagus sp. OGC60D27 TaxID=3458415 RepID=UPI004037A338